MTAVAELERVHRATRTAGDAAAASQLAGSVAPRAVRVRRVAFVLLATALVVLTASSVPTASASVPQPDVPTAIQVEDGHKPFLLAHATGVQIYSCSSTVDGPKWRLLAPQATLFGDNGQVIGTHFGGPTWQARDGSFVKAQRVDGVTVDPEAIPWLLLKATTQSPGPDGDRLAATTFIQRIWTTGGMEPAAGECGEASVGTVRAVPYTADYRFWKATGADRVRGGRA